MPGPKNMSMTYDISTGLLPVVKNVSHDRSRQTAESSDVTMAICLRNRMWGTQDMSHNLISLPAGSQA
jgi:hypothetical protein